MRGERGGSKGRGGGGCCLLIAVRPSNMLVTLRVGSASIVVLAAKLRQIVCLLVA